MDFVHYTPKTLQSQVDVTFWGQMLGLVMLMRWSAGLP